MLVVAYRLDSKRIMDIGGAQKVSFGWRNLKPSSLLLRQRGECKHICMAQAMVSGVSITLMRYAL